MDEKITVEFDRRIIALILQLFKMADPMGIFLREEVNNIVRQIQTPKTDTKEE